MAKGFCSRLGIKGEVPMRRRVQKIMSEYLNRMSVWISYSDMRGRTLDDIYYRLDGTSAARIEDQIRYAVGSTKYIGGNDGS